MLRWCLSFCWIDLKELVSQVGCEYFLAVYSLKVLSLACFLLLSLSHNLVGVGISVYIPITAKMSSSCQTIDDAFTNAALFENACAIQGSALTPTISTALKTCCIGGGGVQTTPDGCFTYCNITSTLDGVYWSFCLVDNLDTSTSAQLFVDNDYTHCIDDDELGTAGSSTATTVPVGNIATTWLGEGQTLTESSAGSAVTTIVLPVGNVLSAFQSEFDQTTSSGATTTKSSSSGTATGATTTSGKPSSTTTGPASTSSKPSKAAGGVSFSRAGTAFVVGVAIFSVLL